MFVLASWTCIISLGCKLQPQAEGKDARNRDGAALPTWGFFRKKPLTYAGRRQWGSKARAAGWRLETNSQILQGWGACMGSTQCPPKKIQGRRARSKAPYGLPMLSIHPYHTRLHQLQGRSRIDIGTVHKAPSPAPAAALLPSLPRPLLDAALQRPTKP